MNLLLGATEKKSAFEHYEPFSAQPQIFAIILTTLIIVSFSIYFKLKVSKLKPNEAPHGMVLLIELFVNSIRRLVISNFGPKFVRLTPYFLYLFLYLGIGNLISLLGVESPITSYTVSLSMGLVTFIGIFVIGIRFQKFSFWNKYLISVKIKNKKIPILINPMETLSSVVPLISITFRIWGNISAGSIIMGLLYEVVGNLWLHVPIVGIFNAFGGIVAVPFHLYFDVLGSIVQMTVFSFLTLIYWSRETKNTHSSKDDHNKKTNKHEKNIENISK